MDTGTVTNEDLGYTPFFEAGRVALGLTEYPVARVTSLSRGLYRVKNAEGEYLAKVTGKQAFTATSREAYPAVGDWVAIQVLEHDHAVIQGTLPRSTKLVRRHGNKNRSGEKDGVQIIATNIDVEGKFERRRKRRRRKVCSTAQYYNTKIGQ
jgi:ribosome biogenesis GTPase